MPFLLAFLALGLLLQPQMSAWQPGRSVSSSRLLSPGELVAVSAYDGYPDSGAGVTTTRPARDHHQTGTHPVRCAQEHADRYADVSCCAGVRPILAY